MSDVVETLEPLQSDGGVSNEGFSISSSSSTGTGGGRQFADYRMPQTLVTRGGSCRSPNPNCSPGGPATCRIVGLLGTRICLWNRNGKRSVFPSNEGTFSNGLCMRYIDPEAIVGCEDGRALVFDMYSRKCSQIIRLNAGPVKCLSLTDDHLILSGSSHGCLTVSSLSADRQVATLRSSTFTDIRTLCYNPCSHLVFAGTTAGYASCWDIRKMRALWENKVSPNVIYSMQHMRNDTSRLFVGGIDGVLRVLDQDSGEVLTKYVVESKRYLNDSRDERGMIERKRGRQIANETRIDCIPKIPRAPITCLAVGMKKVITTHGDKYIRHWKFNIS